VKVIAWLAGMATLVMAAIYMIVSLNRWEWNRALFFGLIVLIAEIALATGLVLRKLGQLSLGSRADPDVADIIRGERPAPRDRFAWLREANNRTNVFITFLVGGGVLLSGLAWVVDRIAAASSTPHGEAKLANLLTPISYPQGGLLVDDTTALAQDVPGADDAQLRRLLGGDTLR
jgi:hypothetical protein